MVVVGNGVTTGAAGSVDACGLACTPATSGSTGARAGVEVGADVGVGATSSGDLLCFCSCCLDSSSSFAVSLDLRKQSAIAYRTYIITLTNVQNSQHLGGTRECAAEEKTCAMSFKEIGSQEIYHSSSNEARVMSGNRNRASTTDLTDKIYHPRCSPRRRETCHFISVCISKPPVDDQVQNDTQ